MDFNAEAGPSRLTFSRSSSPLTPLSPLSPPVIHLKRSRLDQEATDGEYFPPVSTSIPCRLRGGGKKARPSRASRPARPNGEDTPERKRPPDNTASRKRLTRARARRNSSPSIATNLESIASEDAAIKQEIARLSLGLRDVQGDGNCLFRALADQLWGNQKRHVEVRKLVCDYLDVHRDSMEAFVRPFLREDEGETYENYVEKMRQPKQFGSHIEIQAAARVFRRDIRVIMSTTSFTIPWQSESAISKTPVDDEETGETPRRRTRSSTNSLVTAPSAPPPSSPLYATALADYLPAVRTGRGMLWLALFSLAEHFQSVRRKADGDSGPAEVEDKSAIPHERDASEAARRERGEIIPKATPSAKVHEVLASLPPGHGMTIRQVEGVLARVKGDLGEAVEILLEDIEVDKMSDASSPSPHAEGHNHGPFYRENSASLSSQSDGDSSRTSETSKMTTPDLSGDEEPRSSIVEGLNDLKVKITPFATRWQIPKITQSGNLVTGSGNFFEVR